MQEIDEWKENQKRRCRGRKRWFLSCQLRRERAGEWAGELATTLTVGMGGNGAIGGGPACEFRGDSATVGTIWVFRGSILRSGRNGL